MPKFARVTFSDEHLDLARISQTYDDIDASVRDYFLAARAIRSNRFTGLSLEEVEHEMFALLGEHERSISSMQVQVWHVAPPASSGIPALIS